MKQNKIDELNSSSSLKAKDVLEAIRKKSIKPEDMSSNGDSIFHTICFHKIGTPELYNELVEYGFDINQPGVNSGVTPLMIMVADRSNSQEFAISQIKTMLDAGADVNLRSPRQGITCLHTCHSLEIGKVLLDAGADPTIQDDLGRTPFHSVRNEQLAKLYLERGCHIDTPDYDGWTATHIAVYENNLDRLNFLIKNNANLNFKNATGQTPLHFCEDVDLAVPMLKAGADASLADNDGHLPHEFSTGDCSTLLEQAYETKVQENKQVLPLPKIELKRKRKPAN